MLELFYADGGEGVRPAPGDPLRPRLHGGPRHALLRSRRPRALHPRGPRVQQEARHPHLDEPLPARPPRGLRAPDPGSLQAQRRGPGTQRRVHEAARRGGPPRVPRASPLQVLLPPSASATPSRRCRPRMCSARSRGWCSMLAGKRRSRRSSVAIPPRRGGPGSRTAASPMRSTRTSTPKTCRPTPIPRRRRRPSARSPSWRRGRRPTREAQLRRAGGRGERVDGPRRGSVDARARSSRMTRDARVPELDLPSRNQATSLSNAVGGAVHVEGQAGPRHGRSRRRRGPTALRSPPTSRWRWC